MDLIMTSLSVLHQLLLVSLLLFDQGVDETVHEGVEGRVDG